MLSHLGSALVSKRNVKTRPNRLDRFNSSFRGYEQLAGPFVSREKEEEREKKKEKKKNTRPCRVTIIPPFEEFISSGGARNRGETEEAGSLRGSIIPRARV